MLCSPAKELPSECRRKRNPNCKKENTCKGEMSLRDGPKLPPRTGTQSSCQTPTTEAASEASEAETSAHNSPRTPRVLAPPPTAAQVMSMAAQRGLDGPWLGDAGETYTVYFNGERPVWTCFLKDFAGDSQTFSLSFDCFENKVWWGADKAFFLDASEVCQHPNQIGWYSSGDEQKRCPQFFWYRPNYVSPESEAFDTFELGKACAIRDIEEQLNLPGSNGRLKLPQWEKCYEQSLGGLREFVESCTDKFKVRPGQSRWTWTVALVRGAAEQEEQNTADTATAEIMKQLHAPGNNGFVWIEDWSHRYLQQLGPFRSFIESQPDKFTIIHVSGRGIKIRLAGSRDSYDTRRPDGGQGVNRGKQASHQETWCQAEWGKNLSHQADWSRQEDWW